MTLNYNHELGKGAAKEAKLDKQLLTTEHLPISDPLHTAWKLTIQLWRKMKLMSTVYYRKVWDSGELMDLPILQIVKFLEPWDRQSLATTCTQAVEKVELHCKLFIEAIAGPNSSNVDDTFFQRAIGNPRQSEICNKGTENKALPFRLRVDQAKKKCLTCWQPLGMNTRTPLRKGKSGKVHRRRRIIGSQWVVYAGQMREDCGVSLRRAHRHPLGPRNDAHVVTIVSSSSIGIWRRRWWNDCNSFEWLI